LEPLDGELGVVKRIYALRSKGKTFRAIAEKLNKGGVPTKNGASGSRQPCGTSSTTTCTPST